MICRCEHSRLERCFCEGKYRGYRSHNVGRAFYLKSKAEPQRTPNKALAALRAVLGLSQNFQHPADALPVVEYEIIEEDIPWNSRELTSKDNRRPAGQHVSRMRNCTRVK